MSTIGARITKTRKERGYNQRHLCKLADIQETTLSRYENGTREPQAKIIAKISKALNVSSDYLINGDSVNEEKYDIVSKVTLGYEASKKVKCNYIKEIISELRESSLQSVDDLVSEFGFNISVLEESGYYNFNAIYNKIGTMNYLFLNPNISENYKNGVIAHIIGYMLLFCDKKEYFFYDFNRCNSNNIGQMANIFAVEYLIDNNTFIEKLSLGDDEAIAKELKVPVSFIEYKKRLFSIV